MSTETGIGWTDSTFNPWMGCTAVSPACDHCYAQTLVEGRFKRAEWGPGKPRVRTSAANWKLPLQWEREHEAFYREHGRNRRVFCASLADVFDNEVDPAWRDDLFRLIAATPHLTWQLLTKRIGNAAEMMFLARGGHLPLLKNVWIGITICNQQEADRDIPKLLAVPAAKRFLSIEPMLGAIELTIWIGTEPAIGGSTHRDQQGVIRCDLTSTPVDAPDWVIAGGESGPHARPSHPDWLRSLRDQCAAAGVPFFFKQWGEFAPLTASVDMLALDEKTVFARVYRDPKGHPDGQRTDLIRIGTKASGNLLDGIKHEEFPA